MVATVPVPGILVPGVTAPGVLVPGVLVPGVAFDEKGMRLGYGGGFYDRYLKQKENLHRTGIAFGEQIVKRIPTEIHDHPMDDVITEQQWYRPKRTTGGE